MTSKAAAVHVQRSRATQSSINSGGGGEEPSDDVFVWTVAGQNPLFGWTGAIGDLDPKNWGNETLQQFYVVTFGLDDVSLLFAGSAQPFSSITVVACDGYAGPQVELTWNGSGYAASGETAFAAAVSSQAGSTINVTLRGNA